MSDEHPPGEGSGDVQLIPLDGAGDLLDLGSPAFFLSGLHSLESASILFHTFPQDVYPISR